MLKTPTAHTLSVMSNIITNMLKQTWYQNFTIIIFINFQQHGLELNALT